MPEGKSYQDLIETFESAKTRVDSLHEIPGELFSMKPAAGRWSTDEICRHLILFNGLYIGAIEKAAETAPVTSGSKESFTAGFFFRKYAGYLEPPYKMKVKTVKPFRPAPGQSEPDKPEVIRRLGETQETMLNLLTSFRDNRTDLEKTKGKNPVLKFLPMSLIDFIVLLDAHQRRHFWQIEQTLSQIKNS